MSGLEETPPDFYETLTESLNTAGFLNVKTMTKHAMEIVDYLEKEGTLKEYNITKADAMTLAVYTYDNGPDNFESNPYRMINKALAERDKGSTQVLRGYILRLLTALRKLPKYSSEAADGSKLYRAVTNISENAKTVGKIHIWPAFTSTSTDEDSVVDFLDKIGDDRGEKYIFEIGGYFDKGYNIRKLSFHSGEDGKKKTKYYTSIRLFVLHDILLVLLLRSFT